MRIPGLFAAAVLLCGGVAFGSPLSTLATPAAAAVDEPSVTTVLDRAAEYVAGFHRQLSSIVAEERYVQHWSTASRGGRKGSTDLGHRELLSDVLLVKPLDTDDWLQYRDVYEVDGTPIRDRRERIGQLFREGTLSSDARMRTILEDSARYNIGDIQRNVNTPLFPLQFLRVFNQCRFTFTRTTDVAARPTTADSEEASAFRVSTEVWVIAYRERRSDTMIHTAGHRDFPSRGRFWIEPGTGRVLMSELLLENRSIKVAIDVSYQSEPLLGLFVPVEMRERYEAARTHSLIECRATYGRFRQL